MKKIIERLLNTRAAGLYILLFAIAIGAGTFIENDFGTSAAQKLVYQARWFEILLFLFAASLVYNIIKFKMVRQRRWALLTFHLAMIVILLGAAVTRYTGTEGMMHIREQSASDTFLSRNTYLRFDYRDQDQQATFYEPVLFASIGNNRFDRSYKIAGNNIRVHLKQVIPKPKQTLIPDENGRPILKIVVAGRGGRQEYFLQQGQMQRIQGLVYNFTDTYMPGAVNISLEGDQPMLKADFPLSQMVMATRQQSVLEPREAPYPLRLRSMYSDGTHNFVFGDFRTRARTSLEPGGIKLQRGDRIALVFDVDINGQSNELVVFGSEGQIGTPKTATAGPVSFSVSYGAKEVKLPFSIALRDFIMERYPGTDNPSSYASEVTLIDPRKDIKKDYRIYMNHILNYDGYRFFQSSYDPDERGTVLSVNHDFWGTWISYTGYTLLTIGFLLSFFSKRGRFQQLSKMLDKMKNKASLMLLFGLLSVSLRAQDIPIVDKSFAAEFSRVIVQDLRGRMKPIHTLSREILRKLYRRESVKGQNADQVILGMYAAPDYWRNVPMIKLGAHKKVFKLLHTDKKYISYKDFFDPVTGTYLLRDEVRKAYNTPSAQRGVYEKELIKIDERVNVASMAFNGAFFRLIPLGDERDTWQGPGRDADASNLSPVTAKFFPAFRDGLREAIQTGDYSYVHQLITELNAYQKQHGGHLMPSPAKVKAEILLNRLNVFSRLALGYFFLGLALLILLFASVFKPTLPVEKAFRILVGLAIAAFVFHTIGLGLRWYVSGRAPWSNGYESMIYIAWTTVLAGMIFSRKSIGGMAATMILAATILLVAFLSSLNPEITPLVPVLKSYWLTIHVSLEAGSYGFLMLGAIIGLINLLLLTFVSTHNKARVKRIVKELSIISEMTLIGGLFMLSIGTYLGGVWANESWGRYWGWDAKETWALVTILVYAFILHMRIIPRLHGLFLYNVMTIFGWASVIMTYYGVNYYLSGLHSYATGDPVPIPTWVYILTGFIFAISVGAYLGMKRTALRL